MAPVHHHCPRTSCTCPASWLSRCCLLKTYPSARSTCGREWLLDCAELVLITFPPLVALRTRSKCTLLCAALACPPARLSLLSYNPFALLAMQSAGSVQRVHAPLGSCALRTSSPCCTCFPKSRSVWLLGSPALCRSHRACNPHGRAHRDYAL